jgi:hypothetical protein
MMTSRTVMMMTAAALVGAVAGFLAATGGTASAMAAQTALRDEQRDNLAKSVQRVIDSAAATLTDRDRTIRELEAKLAARTPKTVKSDAGD